MSETRSRSTQPPERAGEGDLWSGRVLKLLGAILLLRIVYAFLFPLDLAPDESYYWDWGRRPDIGYFSKPPMIGWLMAVAGAVGRDSMFFLKLFPGLLTTAGLGFVFLLGRDLFGPRAGFWAVVTLLVAPANAALNIFFTIDAPLFLFWSASLWFAWRWWQAGSEGRAGAGRWAVGLTVGLGLGYLTKQIQLVFPLLLLAFTALAGGGGRRLRDPRLWMAIGVSLLFLLPPLVWNWRHEWITFRHTADELSTTPFQWARSAKFVGEFLGGQAGLGGGLLWVLMVGTALHAARRWRELSPGKRFLVLFFLPGWLAYAALSLHQRVEQNWPMVFYTAAAVLLAGELDRFGRWLRVAWAMGAGLTCALMLVPFILPASPMAGAKSDPTARIRGWRTLAEEVAPFRRALPRPAQTFLLAPDDRYVASALAFYLPDHPRTYSWENPRSPESQYGIWGLPYERAGDDALVIVRNPDAPAMEAVRQSFREWTALGEVAIRLGPQRARDRRYFVFLGGDFQPRKPEAGGAGGAGGR